MSQSDYWIECITRAAEECRASLTTEQIEWIAGDVEGCHENYGLAYDQPESPHKSEADDLRRQLAAERNKITCRECGGSGVIVTPGPCHSAESQCWKCRGEGRVLP